MAASNSALVIASGAGSELRQALGTAVFFGMAGVTGFGLLFTPTFYVVCRNLAEALRCGPRPNAETPRPKQPRDYDPLAIPAE